MKSIRITFATIALSATGFFVQANEITEFAPATTSNVARATVKADTQAASHAGLLRYNTVGPTVVPMSMKTREQVRVEASAARSNHEAVDGSFFVGGM